MRGFRIKPPFKDRLHAGEIVGRLLTKSPRGGNILVLALPRGGVPIGYEIARFLKAELDVFLVRKLGFPGEEELAIGAIASGGVRVLSSSLVREAGLSDLAIEQLTAREFRELQQREAIYRSGKPAVAVENKSVIVADDGLATGASMKAAIRALKLLAPKSLTVAVPVGSPETCRELKPDVDEVICAHEPDPLVSVGTWYEDFRQVTDEEVQTLLNDAGRMF